MAEVFKAEHRHLGQIRGLKVLLPEIAAQPDLLSRLLTEARTMARLRHPTIAEVYDCDVQGDSAFIVMEYLPGITLRTWCEHVGKLARNPGLAAAIVGVLADGLAFAHQHGVVHRDLKPENVLLIPFPDHDDAFSLKILDFGVAKLVQEQPILPTEARLPPQQGVNHTQHGCIVGTPLYMAPEQWRPGHPIDHRVDIYALGCVLFELLCGRPPFSEEDTSAIMRAHLSDPPPDVTVLQPEIGSRFQTLIARMLAKSLEDRHATMEEVLIELESISGHRRSQWNEMLRTPRAGAMTARGTLVISLEKTIVDKLGLRGRLFLNGRRVRDLLPKLPKLDVLSPLRNLGWLPRLIPKVSGLWQTVTENLSRLRTAAGRLARPLRSALLRLRDRMVSGNTARLTVVVCASVIASGALLWTARALLTSTGHVTARPARPAVNLAPDRASIRSEDVVTETAVSKAAAEPVAGPAITPPPPLSPLRVPTQTPPAPVGIDQRGLGARSGPRDRGRPSHPANIYRPVDD